MQCDGEQTRQQVAERGTLPVCSMPSSRCVPTNRVAWSSFCASRVSSWTWGAARPGAPTIPHKINLAANHSPCSPQPVNPHASRFFRDFPPIVTFAGAFYAVDPCVVRLYTSGFFGAMTSEA